MDARGRLEMLEAMARPLANHSSSIKMGSPSHRTPGVLSLTINMNMTSDDQVERLYGLLSSMAPACTAPPSLISSISENERYSNHVTASSGQTRPVMTNPLAKNSQFGSVCWNRKFPEGRMKGKSSLQKEVSLFVSKNRLQESMGTAQRPKRTVRGSTIGKTFYYTSLSLDEEDSLKAKKAQKRPKKAMSIRAVDSTQARLWIITQTSASPWIVAQTPAHP